MTGATEEIALVFLGDSFVNGTGDPGYLGWTGRVCAWACARGTPLTYYNLAVRGATSDDVLARWRAESEPRLHDDMDGRLVVAFGGNDLFAEDPQAAIERAATNLETLIVDAGRPVFVVGPPPVAGEGARRLLTTLSDRFADVCASSAVPYLPVLEPLEATGTWAREAAAGDGFHPGAEAYEELAATVDRSRAWRNWLTGDPDRRP